MAIILDLDSSSVGTDLSGLRARLVDRGFDDLDEGQLDYLLNTAYQEICDLEDWPFCEANTSGAPPLTVSTLRKIRTVRDTVQGIWLVRTDRSDVVEAGLDPNTAGAPVWYFIDSGTEIRTYPLGGTLSVRYYEAPAAMALAADTPIVPERFRDIIVLGAARLGMMDESASGDLGAFSQEYERRLDVMREALLYQHRQAEGVSVLAPGDDY